MKSTAILAALLWSLASASAARADFYEHTVQRGETLIGLSERLLLQPAQWPKLQRLNRVRDPHRLKPGSVLQIPAAWMRSTSTEATVVQVQGKANVASGARLGEGSTVQTEGDGFVTLRLADGSLAKLQSGSELRLESLREYPGTQMNRSTLRLLRGRVESLVERLRGGGRNEVTTPVGNAVVRGTHFRVAADGPSGEQRSEVLEGAVQVGGAADGAKPQEVAAGFGTVVGADGRVAPPVALLPSPGTAALPVLLERTLLRFAFQPVAGAVRYRAEVARDRSFQSVVGQSIDTAPQARFGDIADGDYVLRVRAIDARGLEGRDAEHAFRLKARPEPPFGSQPADKGKSVGEGAMFAWSESAEAAHYRFQLASDPGFRTVVREEAVLRGNRFEVMPLPPGEYHWRIASVRASGDQGPFGDARRFTQKPPPPAPEPPEIGEDTLQFSWSGEPGQTFEFQLARDASFRNLVETRELKEPRVLLSRPGPGQYFMRYRARDPDGFVGPFASPQKFELPTCVTDGSGRCVKSTYDRHIGTH